MVNPVDQIYNIKKIISFLLTYKNCLTILVSCVNIERYSTKIPKNIWHL